MSGRNKWSRNVENLDAQTTKVSFQLSRYLKSVGTLPYHVFFKLFNTIVLPTVCYGAEIWGFQEYYVLSCMHAKFCKRFLGLSTKAANLVQQWVSVDKHQFLFKQLHSVSSTGFIF